MCICGRSKKRMKAFFFLKKKTQGMGDKVEICCTIIAKIFLTFHKSAFFKVVVVIYSTIFSYCGELTLLFSSVRPAMFVFYEFEMMVKFLLLMHGIMFSRSSCPNDTFLASLVSMKLGKVFYNISIDKFFVF